MDIQKTNSPDMPRSSIINENKSSVIGGNFSFWREVWHLKFKDSFLLNIIGGGIFYSETGVLTMSKRYFVYAAALCAMLVISGCTVDMSEKDKNSPYTAGNVQMTIKQGITTQAEVLEKFGAPNLVTIDSSGDDVWTYQKYATVSREAHAGGYATIVLLGYEKGSSGFEQSQKTMTLIIKFGQDKKVKDFKCMKSNF